MTAPTVRGTPLDEILPHLAEEAPPHDGGKLARAVLAVARAGERISRAVDREDLEGGAEYTGTTNIRGEKQKALDIRSNDIVVEEAERSGCIRAVVSEELAEPAVFPGHPAGGVEYTLRTDPLDGSSNLGVNVTVGTIFSLVAVPEGADPGSHEALLLPGDAIAAAGYVIYGPATLLVFAAGGPVRAFLLDAEAVRFRMTVSDLKIPAHRAIYSINEAYHSKWTPEVRRLADSWRHGTQPGGPWSLRYIGSMVADVHRTLVQGGVFFYPGEAKQPEGKLRLLYEGQPLAHVVERAGGRATDGVRRLLDIRPSEIHQRCPMLLGSRDTVLEAEKTLRG